jgi:hypothetical protein
MMERTEFVIREGRRKVLTGEIAWGETVNYLRFHHPMSGSLTDNPMHGWADAPDQTAHAEVAAVVSAAQRDPGFIDDHVGFERVEWRWTDGHLCFVKGE